MKLNEAMNAAYQALIKQAQHAPGLLLKPRSHYRSIFLPDPSTTTVCRKHSVLSTGIIAMAMVLVEYDAEQHIQLIPDRESHSKHSIQIQCRLENPVK